MNLKNYFVDFNHFIIHIFIFIFSLYILQPFAASSNERGYELVQVADLGNTQNSQSNWQQIVANPSNIKQHFIIQDSGQIYLIDDAEIKSEPIIDMSIFQKKNTQSFKLTAIELHPNFALRDHVGYSTFYTAHIEDIDKQSKTKRIQASVDELKLPFDTVITEWKFNAVNHRVVDNDSKREVLRISVPDTSMAIKQISFNPYIRSWHDDFGSLYVALYGDEKWKIPLYSGVVLRINPEKFGAHSFRIPDTNPYLKNSQINDAIYLLGAQKINKFVWPGKNSEEILVSHKYDNNYLLSLTDSRTDRLNDWRNSGVKNILYRSDDTVHDFLMYQGRDLTLFRSQLLLLRQMNQHWAVSSLDFNLSDSQQLRDEITPQLVWSIPSQKLPNNSQIMLSSNQRGEVFFLERTLNTLFHLTEQAMGSKNIDSGENDITEEDSFGQSLMIIIIIVIIGTIYHFFIRKEYSVKNIVRQQFSSIKLSESHQQIELYHRHQSEAELKIDVVSIISSEIKLNEHSINIINTEDGYGFNYEIEKNLSAIFSKEKVDKMVDGKVRQISLLLTDNSKNTYTVCLYLRKGSSRITKKSYVKVINELIDWCWLVGEKINASNTDKRPSESIALSKENKGVKSTHKNSSPLHHQAEDIRTASHNTSQPLVKNATSIGAEVNHPTKKSDDKHSEIYNQTNQDKVVNTELVNALEKLVNLKQQGFLTMDEFSKAKKKVLQDLLEK